MTIMTAEQLQKPLSPLNPKAWYYTSIRALMSSVGRLSQGIDIGYTHGFDSGVMLEYVYQNQANGKFGIGKAIDSLYLNAPGWQGIRNRGKLVRKTIADTICEKAQQNPGQPIKLVDLACMKLLKTIVSSKIISAKCTKYSKKTVFL